MKKKVSLLVALIFCSKIFADTRIVNETPYPLDIEVDYKPTVFETKTHKKRVEPGASTGPMRGERDWGLVTKTNVRVYSAGQVRSELARRKIDSLGDTTVRVILGADNQIAIRFEPGSGG